MIVAAVQYDIIWGNTKSNLEALNSLLPEGCDLIVLPEMFHCGFSMSENDEAQHNGGIVLEWMKDRASALHCAIAGSVAVVDKDGMLYNRLYFVQPDGTVDFYDKRHLFRMAGEHEVFTPGEKRVVVNFRGWRILLQVCYDLRFPVFSRNKGDYDIALYPANWPDARTHPWLILLQARAIENLCYVIGANRVGNGDGISYRGTTAIVDFKGQIISKATDFQQEVIVTKLDKEALDRFRNRFPAWMDADNFNIL